MGEFNDFADYDGVLPLLDMTSHQKPLATALLSAGLSQRGLMKALTVMSLEDVLKDFLFSGRGEDFAALIGVLDPPNLGRQRRPFVDQFEDVQVKFVDLRAQIPERRRGPIRRRRGRTVGFARHGWSRRGVAGIPPYCMKSLNQCQRIGSDLSIL